MIEVFFLKNYNVISNYYVFTKFNKLIIFSLKLILLNYTKNKFVEIKSDYRFIKKYFFSKPILVLKIDFYDSLEHKDLIRNVESDITIVFEKEINRNYNIELAIKYKEVFS